MLFIEPRVSADRTAGREIALELMYRVRSVIWGRGRAKLLYSAIPPT
jgi:hypothetical protein